MLLLLLLLLPLTVLAAVGLDVEQVEKTTQRTASYARPWMTASVDKPLVAR